MECPGFQISRRRQPPFSRILDAAGPHFAKRRRTGPSALIGYGAAGQADVHSGSLILIKRILNVTYIPLLENNFPSPRPPHRLAAPAFSAIWRLRRGPP